MTGNNIVELIHSAEPHFNEIAQKDNLLTWKAEARFALQAVQKNTALQTCTPQTIKGAIINIAACGLTLNPADGYAYLVPEYNKDTNQKECMLRISYKGMIKGATDTGAISWVKAEVVKEGEEFEYNGISEPPIHRIKEPFTRSKKKTIGAYVVAQTPSGAYLVDMIDADEITQIQQCAKTQMVWSKWPDEMAKKAVIKRAAKQWPKVEDSSRLHRMIDIVNDYEGGFEPKEREKIGTDAIDVDKVNKAEIKYRELLDADVEEIDRAKAMQEVHYGLTPDEQIEVHNRFGQEKLDLNPRKNKRSAIKEYLMMKVEEVA